MNTKFSVLVMALAMVTLASCKKDEPANNAEQQQTPEEIMADSAHFVGTLKMGNDFEQSGIYATTIKTSDNTLNVRIDKMKLSDVAPVGMTIEAFDIQYVKAEDASFNLTGTNVKIALNGEMMSEYTLPDVSGKMTENTLHFEFVLMGMNCVYDATLTNSQPADEDNNEDSDPILASISALGTLSVDFQGQTYDTENYTIRIDIVSESTLNLVFNQVQFVPQMPVKIDIVVPGIGYVQNANSITFSGDNIVPSAAGISYDQYKVSHVEGSVVGTTMTVDLTFGSFPTHFTGTVQS